MRHEIEARALENPTDCQSRIAGLASTSPSTQCRSMGSNKKSRLHDMHLCEEPSVKVKKGSKPKKYRTNIHSEHPICCVSVGPMTPPQNRLEATPCCEDLAKYVLAEGVDVHLISKRSVEIICCGLTPLEFAQGGEGTFGIRSSKQN